MRPESRFASQVLRLSFIALSLFTSIATAQEQFLFDDAKGQTPSTASTPDGKTQFEIYGAWAITEGDIVLGNAFDLIHGKAKPQTQTRGLARKTLLDKWPNGIVYYSVQDGVAVEEAIKVQAAVDHWNEYSSLSFVERTAKNAATIDIYIDIQPSDGCGSYVGYIGRVQEMWINPKCSVGSIIHELGHAVGLFHEHTRPDRDNFITILWDNIPPAKHFNFEVIAEGTANVSDYDYGSIMHYGTRFFSSNGKPTISVPDGTLIGQRVALSGRDLAAVDQLYATDISLTEQITENVGEATQVDAHITNLGSLGANTLHYTLPLRKGDRGASFSGPQWSCKNLGISIDCYRDVLVSEEQTKLSIRYIAAEPELAPLAGRIKSKTYDLNLFNNGDLPAEEMVQEKSPAPQPIPDATPVVEQETEAPPSTASAQGPMANQEQATPQEQEQVAPQTGQATQEPAPAQGGSGGGGVGWLLLVSLLVQLRSRPRV